MNPLFTFLAVATLTTTLPSPLPASTYSDVEDKVTLSVLTPSLSDRKTAKIRLSNGLEAYLISDPQADSSAAALSVNVGSWSDPIDAPGLAHFCEHLLFMGTEKFPEEADYHRFVKENGGWSNAYTTSDHTSYMFAVNNDAFKDTLDRFSWFFKAPLFNSSGVDRELRAIESEYTTHLEKDSSRRIHVLKKLTSPEHPYSKFTIGNKSTLENIPPERVRQWYEKYYSANLMHLVLYSNLPIEELKKLAEQDFSTIENKNITIDPPKAPILDKQHIGKMLYIAPVKDTRSLSLMWELPKTFSRQLEKRPGELIAFILGHEGKDSLLSLLKKQDLAEGLSAGGYDMSDNSYFFEVSVNLTQKGIDELNSVIAAIFGTIAQVKKEGVPQYAFDEEQGMDRLRFEYQEREDAFETVSAHARALIEEPLESYPEKTRVIQKYDKPLIDDLLAQLKPDNCLYILTALPKHTGIHLDKKESWLGAQYAVKPIKQEAITAWKNTKPLELVKLPFPNPFVPKSMKLVEKQHPKTDSLDVLVQPEILINDSERGKVFFASDDRYQVPEIQWRFSIKTPYVDLADPETIVLADLYAHSVEEQLNSYAYPALLAGLSFSLTRGDDGIDIKISGYSENSDALIERIFDVLRHVNPTESQFNTYKESLAREYRNFHKESPLTLGMEVMQSILYRNFVTEREKSKTIEKVAYSDFQRYADEIFNESYLEALLYGNMTRSDANKIWALYLSKIEQKPYPKNRHSKREVILLPENQGPFYIERAAEQTGNATILAIQNGPYSFKKRAHQQVLGKLIDEPFFSELRTKQQTGYVVFSSAQEIERQLFTLFAAQSATHDTHDLLARYEQFIEEFLNQLESDPGMKERFETVRASVVEQLEQPPKNMEEMVSTLELLAFDYDGDFEFLDKRIHSFNQMSFEDFVKITKENYGKKNRRRLATMIRGSTENTVLRYHPIKTAAKLRRVSHFIPAIPVR